MDRQDPVSDLLAILGFCCLVSQFNIRVFVCLDERFDYCFNTDPDLAAALQDSKRMNVVLEQRGDDVAERVKSAIEAPLVSVRSRSKETKDELEAVDDTAKFVGIMVGLSGQKFELPEELEAQVKHVRKNLFIHSSLIGLFDDIFADYVVQ